jgi:hypothetical protein
MSPQWPCLDMAGRSRNAKAHIIFARPGTPQSLRQGEITLANDSGINITTVRRGRGRPLGHLQPEDMQRKYRGQRKFSIREIKEALHRNFGNCYMAAKALNETERERGGTRTIDRRAVAYM